MSQPNKSTSRRTTTQVRLPRRLAICDAAFTRLLLVIFLALVVGAALAISGFVLLAPTLHPRLQGISRAVSAPVINLGGNTFRAIIGEVAAYPDHIEITGLEGDRAFIARSIREKADEYPFVEVRVDCNHPGLRMYLFWRNSVNAKTVSDTPITLSGGGSTTIFLHGSRGWLADITEIGVDIYGELRECPLQVTSVSLLPYSASTLLSGTISQWTAFTVWDQGSINTYRGVPVKPILYPTLAVGCWLILSYLICVIFFYIQKLTVNRCEQKTVGIAGKSIAIAITIGTVGWLSLDALWLYKNTLQAKETRYRFAGKTLHEKKLNDWDSNVFAFVEQIKSNQLVPEGEVINLYYEEEDKSTTGRLRYHLLPEYRVTGIKNLANKNLKSLDGPENYFIVLSSGQSSEGKNKGRHEGSEDGEVLQKLYEDDRFSIYKKRKLKTIEETQK